MTPPIEKGDRVVVHGMRDFVTRVSNVQWIQTERRWRIDLDWGEFGTSYVYDHDEGDVWYRYAIVN